MARSDDFMLTAEELRIRHRKRRRIIAFVSVVLVLALMGIFGARPASRAIKGWQARQHAAKAFAFLEQKKWSEARGEAVAAYQLRASEPQALRAVARYLSRTRQQQALEFWKNLRDVAMLTREDLRDEASVALLAGESDRASASIHELLASEGKAVTPADWLLAAQLALQKGSTHEAQRDLQKVFDDAKATERELLQAAALELASSSGDAETDRQKQDEAWSRITKLADGKSDTALDALTLLAQRTLSSPGGTHFRRSQKSEDARNVVLPSELARALEKHPLAKAPQKLTALDLLIQEKPEKKDACIERAIAQWKDSDPTSLAALATWLNGKGEFQKTLDTIPLERALQTREVFLQHVDALGALGRWSEIKQLLEAERFPLDSVVQRMYLARCNAQLGEKTAAENNWHRALEAAGNNVQNLLTLGNYAEKNGALEIAEAAFTTMAIESPKLRTAQHGRLRIAQANKDTKKIHAILAEMLKLWPNDIAIQNDEAYTRLLLLPNDSLPSAGGTSFRSSEELSPTLKIEDSGNAVPPTTQVSSELVGIEHLGEELVRREPSSLPHRTLLALARLKQHRPVAALGAYANIQTTPNTVSPSALAVHAAVLAANDDGKNAQDEVRKIDPKQLLPEENALLEALR